MQSGTLTVTGNNSTLIPLLGHPHKVLVHFKDEIEPVPCNPHHHHDHLEHKIEHIDEDRRHHHEPGHHHHDRQYALFIRWEVSGVREIDWIVIY
jgi:hypothetical protein